MYDLYQGVEISTAVKSTYSNYYNGSSELIGGSGPKGPPGENGNFSKDELSIFSKLGMSLTGFGETWTLNSLPSNLKSFSAVSLSASGKYQTVISDTDDEGLLENMYVSTDFGATWNVAQGSPKKKWKSVSLSASGQYQTVVGVGDYIYISSDFGVTWTQSNSLKNIWLGVSLSASGQYQTAIGNGLFEGEIPPIGDFIYVSSDFGLTWAKSNSLQKFWSSVSLSASGQYQTAVGLGMSNQGEPPADFIYVSSDFGVTWTQSQNAPEQKWNSISLSASGQYQTAVAKNYPGEYIYVSIDFGNTWTHSNFPQKQWHGVSVSGSGQHITACYYEPSAPNVYIYTSKSFPPQL